MRRSDLADIRLKRIVIIGGGFGGIKLAKELKDLNYQILLIDKHNYHCFQPLMYQVASSVLEAESIVYPIRKIFHKQKNLFFRLGNVTEINPSQNKVYIDEKSISYDILVIASGARSNFFKNEGLIISSMPMKTVDEALDLRSLIIQNFEKALLLKNLRKKQSLMNFVIAGAGPTGVEADLADRPTARTQAAAPKRGAVGEHQRARRGAGGSNGGGNGESIRRRAGPRGKIRPGP